jgi:periplasmic copper chaperone A
MLRQLTTGRESMFRSRICSSLLGAVGLFAGCATSLAHVALENGQAPVGSQYKAVLQVLHGCNGSATTTIRVRIPDGIVAVRPMPKAGWKLDVVTGKYEKPHSLGHAQVSEGVTEVAWSGGNLPNAFYDEFVFMATVAGDLQEGQTIYFPVVQQCERGVHRWIDIPTGPVAAGAHGEGAQPAPGLKLLPRR